MWSVTKKNFYPSSIAMALTPKDVEFQQTLFTLFSRFLFIPFFPPSISRMAHVLEWFFAYKMHLHALWTCYPLLSLPWLLLLSISMSTFGFACNANISILCQSPVRLQKNSIKIQSHTFIESAQRAKHALWLRSTNNELSRHRSLSSHAYQHSVEFSTNRKRKQSVRLLQRPSILFHCYGYIIPLLF